MTKTTVFNLSFSGAWGGLEMSTVKMTRLFHQAGYASYGICQPDSPIEKALVDQGLPHRSMTAKNYVSPSTTLKLRKLIRELEPRAIFLHSMRDIWLVRPALAGFPDVKLYGFARMFFKNISKKDFGHRVMYSRLDGMVALSEIQKRHLVDCLPVPENKFTVIPNGVDTSRFQPRARRDDIRAAWGIGPEHTLFGLIGRLDRQKGSFEFVEAASVVLERHPNARFVLVGGNTIGESEIDREIKALLAEKHLHDKVLLTDFRSDIPDVMNALDVFVMPSYEENFANVLLEALASGLPSIGTNAGGTPEILSFGDVGLLCEPQSSRSLAQAMDHLLRNTEERQSLSKKARAKALADYDMPKVFKRIESLVV